MTSNNFVTIIDSGMLIGSINNNTINKYASITSISNNIIQLHGNTSDNDCILSGIANPVNLNDAINKAWFDNNIPANSISKQNSYLGINNKVLITDNSGNINFSNLDTSILPYLSNITSDIQLQISNSNSNKQISNLGSPNKVVITDISGNIISSTLDSSILPYLSTITSDAQIQLNNKQNSNLGTSNKLVITDASGNINLSSINSSILPYLSTITSDAQIQLNNKQNSNLGTSDKVVITDASGNINSSILNSSILPYLSTITSDAQIQLNNKQNSNLGTPYKVIISDASGNINLSPLNSTVLPYLTNYIGISGRILISDVSGNITTSSYNASTLSSQGTSVFGTLPNYASGSTINGQIYVTKSVTTPITTGSTLNSTPVIFRSSDQEPYGTGRFNIFPSTFYNYNTGYFIPTIDSQYHFSCNVSILIPSNVIEQNISLNFYFQRILTNGSYGEYQLCGQTISSCITGANSQTISISSSISLSLSKSERFFITITTPTTNNLLIVNGLISGFSYSL